MTPARRNGLRLALAAMLAFCVPLAALGAWWTVTASHQVVPGLDGCRFVRDRQPQIDCYGAQFRRLVAREGLSRALVAVDRAAARSATLGADCHLAWHPIGEAAGKAHAAAGRSYGNISARTSCQQGYAHGYTIGYLERANPDLQGLAAIARSECSAHSDALSLLNCMHAFGHSIARRARGDVREGTQACMAIDYSGLRSDYAPGARHQCLYGMYMEVAMIEIAAGSTVTDNCDTAINADARRACYAYLPSRVGAIRGNLRDAARSCHDLAPAGQLRTACVKNFALGLDNANRCGLLVTAAERATCHDIQAGDREARRFEAERVRSTPRTAPTAPAPRVQAPPPGA